MSKMAILIKQQKPGKNRAKNSKAELFIQASNTSLAQGKRILGEIKAIAQKTIVLQDVGGTKEQIVADPLKTNPVGSSKEATKTHTKPGSAWNSAREGKEVMQSCRNRLNNLQKESGGQKVSNPALMRKGTNKKWQRCHAGRRAAMPTKTGSNAIRDEQKVCIHVRMVGQAPGRESSELAEPESRPPRGNPKLEEQSVGGSVALSPGIPDAQQIRFPGESTKPPVVKGAGLVDGAMSPEKPVARKPDQRKVSIKVSIKAVKATGDDPHGLLKHGPIWTYRPNDPHGLLVNRPNMAHKQGMPPGSLTTKGIQPTQKAVKATGDDPHGLLKHGPIWTYRPNDPHGLLVNRPNMAHKQGMPPGSLTIKGIQPTQGHEGNLNRGTMSKTVAQAGQPVPALSTELRGVYAGHPNDGHNRNQLRFTIGKTLVSILGLILLVSMIIQGKTY